MLLIVCRRLVIFLAIFSLNMLLSVVGRNIVQARKHKGWSQEQLAAASGLHRTYVGGVERGERNLSLKNLARIAAALEVHPSTLLLDRHDAQEGGTGVEDSGTPSRQDRSS